MRAFRAAMDELGLTGELLATDITTASAACALADKALLVPRVNSLHYIPALKKIVTEQEIRLIVPVTDLDLRSLARHREAFEELGCTVMIGTEPAVKLCRDKKQFASALKKAGMPAIRTFSLATFQDNPFYPCFVKPLRGSASHGSAKIENEQELRAHIHVFGEQLLVQDYVPGREYTLDVYKTRAGEVKCIVPRQRLVVRSGEVDQGMTVMDDDLIRGAKTLCEHIDGLWGVFCCQCRRPNGDRPYFFELNPRFGGGSPLSIAAGANLPLYVLQEWLGREVTTELGQFEPNLLMLRYADHVTLSIEDASQLPGMHGPEFK